MQALCDRFAANLRAAREQAGLSPEELAHRAALASVEVLTPKRLEDLPAIDAVARIADVLDTSVEALIEGISWDPETLRFTIAP